VIATAHELFSREGVRPIGVNRIVEEAGVAKMTLYSHFESKEALVFSVLERHERQWTEEWLACESERRAESAQARLLIVFDMLDEWFHSPNYEGSLFINSLLEAHNVDDPVGAESARRLGNVRSLLTEMAAAAGVHDPQQLAGELLLLICGAIVLASAGDPHAGQNVRAMGRNLVQSALGVGA
jgi:AcrR family transcriptional regulator